MNEINPADAAFVQHVVEGELKVSDITPTSPKPKPKSRNGKKSTKRIGLADWLESWTGDYDQLYMEARELCYVQHKRPVILVDAMDTLRSQARHQRQGGAFVNMPPTDPKAVLAAARKRADEMALRKETVELELRGLRHEENVCRAAINSKDAEAAALAEITLKKLLERRIPDVLVSLRKAKDDEDMALKALRAARGDVPRYGGKAVYGSAEDANQRAQL